MTTVLQSNDSRLWELMHGDDGERQDIALAYCDFHPSRPVHPHSRNECCEECQWEMELALTAGLERDQPWNVQGIAEQRLREWKWEELTLEMREREAV